MIIRKNYRAGLPVETAWKECLGACLETDAETVKQMIAEERCLTVALYRHENMFFLYLEALDEMLAPKELFPSLSEHLEQWSYMEPVFWHAVPKDSAEWARQGKKVRRGRIARLLPDKRDSYVKYHKAIVEEGLLDGDQYQFIAIHEDMLFSYFEEPKIFTHIRNDVQEKSRVIEKWLAADPESHFDHGLSGKENFLLIEEVFSMGTEDRA